MPYRVINALNTLKSYDYMAYAFFVMPSKTFDILPRFFGMYDEPGVVGTIAGAILMTRQFNFKKWINIPIFIAGILSFSLFFYVIFAIYVILFAKYDIRSLRPCWLLLQFTCGRKMKSWSVMCLAVWR